MKKNNLTKKTLSTITLGGLLLSAPLAATYATDDFNENKGQKIELGNEEHLEFVKASLDLQIIHANKLIESVDSEFDTDRLKEIVLEYVELEEFLDSVDVENVLKEELRETFFEFKEESKEISKEFKSIIKTAFNEEERKVFREEFKSDKSALKEKYNIYENKKQDKHKKNRLNLEQINSIDPTIGESLKNGEISYEEAMKEIKVIIDEMEKEDRNELFEMIKIEKNKKDKLN